MRAEEFSSRADWLKSRRLSLGASDAASICGIGYTSPYALWADKCALVPADDDVPEYVEAGSFMEPGIIAWWSHRNGMDARATPLTIIRNPEYPWAHASPDALVAEDAGLDAKNVDIGKAEEWAEGVPLKFQVQGQHTLAVTGRARWYFAAVVGGRKLLSATVERDESFIRALMERERAWWERHVIGREAPEPDGSDATSHVLRLAFPTVADGEIVPLGDEAVALHEELVAAAEVATAAGAIAEECKNKLRAMVGGAQFGVLPGGRGTYRRKQIEGSTYTVNRKPYVDFRFTPKEIA